MHRRTLHIGTLRGAVYLSIVAIMQEGLPVYLGCVNGTQRVRSRTREGAASGLLRRVLTLDERG